MLKRCGARHLPDDAAVSLRALLLLPPLQAEQRGRLGDERVNGVLGRRQPHRLDSVAGGFWGAPCGSQLMQIYRQILYLFVVLKKNYEHP